MILRLFIICPPSEIRADPLKLSIDYTQNHMKRFKGMTSILYSTWDKPSIFWHFFCILLVLCICICFIKYHTVHIVLHKCNNMPVLELRVISILSCASVILQSIRKNKKNETELSTKIVCLILTYFVISIHVHNRSVPYYLTSVGF